MKGADEFKDAFPVYKGRVDYGSLSVFPGEHARGYTLNVYANGVNVFGIVDGNPGWTESYGWLHKGPWQKDFETLVESRMAAIRAEAEKNSLAIKARQEAEIQQQNEKLAAYQSPAHPAPETKGER